MIRCDKCTIKSGNKISLLDSYQTTCFHFLNCSGCTQDAITLYPVSLWWRHQEGVESFSTLRQNLKAKLPATEYSVDLNDKKVIDICIFMIFILCSYFSLPYYYRISYFIQTKDKKKDCCLQIFRHWEIFVNCHFLTMRRVYNLSKGKSSYGIIEWLLTSFFFSNDPILSRSFRYAYS